MPIYPLTGQDRLRSAQAVSALRQTAALTTSGPTRQADSVSLSESARAAASALKRVAGTAEPVREERVQAIKNALADGTYAIDSRQLAATIGRALFA
jgi:flagellar biosynthesis anti-sigma factor FlgM